MSFTTPQALLLLLLLPVLVWLVWPPSRNRTPARQAGTGTFTKPARPRSGWLGLGLRLLIAALLVLSLAGAQIVQAVDNLSVVFLIDASDSMSREASENAERFVREAIAAMGPDDRAGIILFGGMPWSNSRYASLNRPMSCRSLPHNRCDCRPIWPKPFA
jgi:hypothetical protein